MSLSKNAKVLVVAPGWLGDLVMAQTLFKLLKSQAPDVALDVLALKSFLPVLTRMPEVANVITMSIGHGQFQLRARCQFAKKLREHAYTHAFVLPNSWKSAWIPFWAKIPHRIGWKGEIRWGLLNDVRYLDKQILPLMSQRYYALGLPKNDYLPEKLPYPELKVAPEQLQQSLIELSISRNAEQPILALCPGAAFGQAKCWPARHFAILAKIKLEQGWAVWIFGTQKEKAVAETIQQATQNQCLDFTGRTNLAQAIDLLSCASAVVSNDSGLMHVSAALNKPLVVPYGASNPGFVESGDRPIKLLNLHLPCSPCFKRDCPLEHHKCLEDLEPSWVLQSLQELGC